MFEDSMTSTHMYVLKYTLLPVLLFQILFDPDAQSTKKRLEDQSVPPLVKSGVPSMPSMTSMPIAEIV